MDRRLFLRNSALIAAGAVALDQLEILDRLNWKRTLHPGADIRPVWVKGKARYDSSRGVFLLDSHSRIWTAQTQFVIPSPVRW